MRVLVVDDHDINRRAIQLILQPLGCDIATAADGMAALNICETSRLRPHLHGRADAGTGRARDHATHPGRQRPQCRVRRSSPSPPTPRRDDIAACMDAGMTYFVPKPITPPMLLGRHHPCDDDGSRRRAGNRSAEPRSDSASLELGQQVLGRRDLELAALFDVQLRRRRRP